jgi:ribosomal-protein-serine acetyltransferase
MSFPEDEVAVGELVIRRWRAEDVRALDEAITVSREHLRPFMSWVSAELLPQRERENLLRDLIKGFDDSFDAGTDYTYGLLLGQLAVGGCGLHPRLGAGGLEIGYWVRAGYTGRGYATAAASALTTLAFGNTAIERVEIHHDKANAASRRVPEKLGYEFVGEAPSEIDAPGQMGILCSWRIERDEWTGRLVDPTTRLRPGSQANRLASPPQGSGPARGSRARS